MALKRKSDAPTHESRLDYDQRSAAEDARMQLLGGGYGGGAAAAAVGGGAFGRADAATLASRRTVTAAGSGGTSAGATTDPSAAVARKYRRRAYLEGVERLNGEFAAWAEARSSELASRLHSGVESAGPAAFYLDAVHEYLRRAEALKAKYSLEIGDVLTFGTGDCGQLGWPMSKLPGNQTFKRPRIVANLRGCRIVRLACGGLHNVALAEDGTVYTWGCNDDGSLGQFTFDLDVERVDTAYIPDRVTGFLPSPKPPGAATFESRADETIVSVAAGDCQTLCLSSGGNVYFFGSYKDKEGRQWRDLTPPDDTRIGFERLLATQLEEKENEGKTPEQIAAERKDAKYRPKEPDVPPKGKQRWPVHNWRVPGKAKEILCGLCYNAALLDTDGDDNKPQMVTWGMGECGELGRPVPAARNPDGTYNLGAIRDVFLKPSPPIFAGPTMRRTVEAVACGGYHLLVVARDFDAAGGPAGSLVVYSSGLNNYGQLGRGEVPDKSNGDDDNADADGAVHDTLERIEDLDGRDITKVAGGTHHTLCLDRTGRNLYAFGRMDSGQLGTTSTQPEPGASEPRPVPVSLLHRDGGGGRQQDNPVITQISCGANHNLVTTEDGDVYTWGYGDMGALGHGEERDEYRPRKLDVMEGVIRLEEKEKEKKEGNNDPNPGVACGAGNFVVRQICGGGQHSGAIVTRSVGP